MAKKRVPRWMNLLWLVFVFCLTSSYILVAIHRGYNFVQTVGFLGANFGDIFLFAVLAGLVLYGVTMLLPGRAHDSKDGEDDHSGDMANLVP